MIRWQLQGQYIYKYRSLVGCLFTWISLCVCLTTGNLLSAEIVWIQITKQNQVAAQRTENRYTLTIGQVKLHYVQSTVSSLQEQMAACTFFADILGSVKMLGSGWTMLPMNSLAGFFGYFYQFVLNVFLLISFCRDKATTEDTCRNATTIKRLKKIFVSSGNLAASEAYACLLWVLLYVWAMP